MAVMVSKQLAWMGDWTSVEEVTPSEAFPAGKAGSGWAAALARAALA